MRALYLKELKELAWLGVPVALLACLVWGVVPPVRGLLGPSGQTMEQTAYGFIALGLLLGFAPFELERRMEMRSFLVHRGLGLRRVAWTRMAAIATWTFAIVALGLAVVAIVHLTPALAVPGYFARALGALAATAEIAAPAVAAGAFAGCLGERAWLRWGALLSSGFGLDAIGGAASRWDVLSSAFAAWPYHAFCAATFASGVWLAVERFALSTCEDRRPPVGVAMGWGLFGAMLWMPLLLQTTAALQFTARGRAWSENASWISSADGGLVLRVSASLPPGPPSQWYTFPPADPIRLTTGENLVFHPVGGRGLLSRSMLGSGKGLWSGTPRWALGHKEVGHPQVFIDGSWTTWIDGDIESLVTRWWPPLGRAEFAAFRLPPAGPGPEAHRIVNGWTFPTRTKFVLVLDAAGDPLAVLTSPPPDAAFRTIELPGADRLLERIPAGKIALGSEPTKSTAFGFEVFAGEHGNYVFDGDDFVPVAGYEPDQITHHESKHDFRAVVSAYDGLSYEVSLHRKDSDSIVASSRVAPGTMKERLCAWTALAATLARPPAATIAASAWVPNDDDGSATPAPSNWIDPLVLGGRRPWLVALHVVVAAVLALQTRRRLGGRGWAWPAAVLALGAGGWIVCWLLEPRRVARDVAAAPRPAPAWAPIVDRATA